MIFPLKPPFIRDFPRLCSHHNVWVNYNDLTATSLESSLIRGIIPTWPYFRLVNYCNLPRYNGVYKYKYGVYKPMYKYNWGESYLIVYFTGFIYLIFVGLNKPMYKRKYLINQLYLWGLMGFMILIMGFIYYTTMVATCCHYGVINQHYW